MSTNFPIGWVLRASTVGFAVGCRLLQPNTPHFGDLVKVALQPDEIDIFGLIYDVQVKDDPAVRQLILAGEMEPEAIMDQRENRLVPIEISVLVVGYQQNGFMIQGLPPQPPLSLNIIMVSDEADLRTFTENLDYLRLILNARQIPVDELLVANIRRATFAHPPEQQYAFLLKVGRELARLLNHDLVRLEGILRRIKPVVSR